MSHSLVKICAAALALSAPMIARADPFVLYGPTSYAYTANLDGAAGIRNGVPESFSGAGGAVSGNATSNSSAVASGLNAATAQANLAAGTVRATASSSAGSGSFAQSEIADTLYFNNTTDAAIGLTFRFTLDGTITNAPDDVFAGGYAIFTLDGCGGCGNLTQGVDGPNEFGVGEFALAGSEYLLFNRMGIYGFAEYTGLSGPPEDGKYDYGATFDGGYMTGFYQTTVYVPVGLSTMGVRARLNLDCRFGAVCDFGHTGAIKLGPLADGLSYSSASGAFYSDAIAAPEPATWAMMILGFGLTGAAVRASRRRTGTALA
ncbi:MAG: hypothetical protein JWO33_438 [Caulobacteraceae bacterium]|nr:hypothetical protein [Caulobacteraceae bacterium]